MMWLEGGDEMNLPPFEEFRNSITEERYLELCKQINDTEIIQLVDGFTPENINVFCNQLVMFTLKGALKLQFAFLEEYHEWLLGNL